MSRKQWLVVAVLGLLDLCVLGAMGIAVLLSPGRTPPVPSPEDAPPSPVSADTPVPVATVPPTWTPTASPSPPPSPTPELTPTATLTPTIIPTWVPVPSPTPEDVSLLANATFDDVQENAVPGWELGSFVNWAPGDELDPDGSYAAPRFHQADDPRQEIEGPTLQIDTIDWVKLQAWVYQTVEVMPGARVRFRAEAMGFVKETTGGYILKAGVDPAGGDSCQAAEWGDEMIANQDDGVISIISPEVVVQPEGRVTVCLYAETQFAQVYHAAFLDNAELSIVLPDDE